MKSSGVYLSDIRKYKIDTIKIPFAQTFVNLDNTAKQVFIHYVIKFESV